jgi:malate dehydrogenase (oxaloacetate-decarboxylating)(NADP+)
VIKNDRNIFSATLLALGYGDALITGVTRNYNVCMQDIRRIIPEKKNQLIFGMTIMIAKGRTVFISDTTVHELPTAEELTHIAIMTAGKARQMGHEPRVAFLSFSTFGNPMREKAQRIRDTVTLMNGLDVDFEYDGEMSADVALNKDLIALYPFSRLSAPANILIMPALHSAHISSKMLQELGDGVTIGPIIIGLDKPAQIAQMNATVSDIINLAAIAAIDAIELKAGKGSAGKDKTRKKS